MPMNLKFGNLVAMGLLFLCWIFNFVGIGDISWYTKGQVAFGLTTAEVCFNGACQDFKYTDSNLGDSSELKKVRAGGALAMTFLVFNIFVIPLVGFLLFLDTVGERMKFVATVTGKLPKKMKDNMWMLPIVPLGLFSLALLFWIALWPYKDVKSPNPGAAMILVIISIIFCIFSLVALKFLDAFLGGALKMPGSGANNTVPAPASQEKSTSPPATTPASTENPPPYPG